jgi:AbrB family looped-hinge helix DNA binding protein
MYDVQINERGQITIPKELRDKAKLNALDTLKVELDEKGRLMLYKKDFFDDLEDLIKKDLIREGYTPDDFAYKIPERKKELAKSLIKMTDESKKETQQDNYSNLEELKKELKDEDLL